MKWLIICALIGLSLELGKSDKKKKVVEEEPPEQTLPEAADESDVGWFELQNWQKWFIFYSWISKSWSRWNIPRRQ